MKVTPKSFVLTAAGVVFVALACLAYSFGWHGRTTNVLANRDIFQARNGEEIADYLLHIARENGSIVKFGGYQGKICLEPPGGLARPAAERLHGIPVAFEESHESDGIWSISLEREDRVYIYTIPQGKILWKTSGSDKYENLLSCQLKLYIDFLNKISSFSLLDK